VLQPGVGLARQGCSFEIVGGLKVALKSAPSRHFAKIKNQNKFEIKIIFFNCVFKTFLEFNFTVVVF
jgi:hypothetical protein